MYVILWKWQNDLQQIAHIKTFERARYWTNQFSSRTVIKIKSIDVVMLFHFISTTAKFNAYHSSSFFYGCSISVRFQRWGWTRFFSLKKTKKPAPNLTKLIGDIKFDMERMASAGMCVCVFIKYRADFIEYFYVLWSLCVCVVCLQF